jgi:hypothetical protein
MSRDLKTSGENMNRNRVLTGLMVIVVALAAACSKGPDDTAIANDIKAKIFSDADLKAAAVDVAVKDGVVTLSGELASADLQLKLYKLAQGAAGVTKVDDQIRIQGAQLAEAQAAPGEPSAAQPSQAPTTPAGTAPRASAPAASAAAPAAGSPAQPVPEKAAAEPKAVPAQQTVTPPAPPQPVTVVVPAGTRIAVRMADSIDSSTNKPGELFLATLDEAIPLEGADAIPRGTDVYIKLADAKSAGRVTGTSELELQLNKMVWQGKTYPLVSNSYEQKGKSRTKQTATRVGIGAGVGAAIGAIAGGGKGAAIGAAVGGGGATAVQVFTKGQQIKVPSETQIDFSLQAPVAVTYVPKK